MNSPKVLQAEAHSDVVFVYGALRSGTTMFRLMLDTHPQIGNPGEMDFLFDYLTPDKSHGTGWRYDLDGLRSDRVFRAKDLSIPEGLSGLDLLDAFLSQIKARAGTAVVSINLHRRIDRVFQVLPHARVLHMLRDPRDVARSSIQMGWAGTLYHGVAHWIETERAWDRGTAGVDPSQIFEFSYEALFQNIDETLHAVCDFLETEFDPQMLRYHENTTYAPPDASLTEQWKRKCHPAELAEVESRAGALMETRGYERSQPPISLSGLHKLRLGLRNKLYVWKFGMKRFGVITYLAEKLTRRLGLKKPHRFYKRRIQDIATQYLD